MRSIRFLLLITLIFPLTLAGRSKGDSLRIKLREKVVAIKKDNRALKLEGVLTNRTKHNFIFYAFRRTMFLDYSADSVFFNDVIHTGGAGIVLIVLDKSGNRMAFNRESCVDCGKDNGEDSHNPDYLSMVNQKAKNFYIESSELLKARSKKTITLTTPLNVNLERGEYKIFLIYYCGDEIYDLVDKETVRNDEKEFNAKMFQSWIRSDTTKLVVD